jgi:hypothetical protein
MLTARKTSVWSNGFEITEDDRPLGRWDPSVWRYGGRLTVDGREYRVGANMWGTRYDMADGDGRVVATAARIGRKDWTVTADGRTYEFRRGSMWRPEQHLLSGDEAQGSIRKLSAWRSDAVADLPGLPRLTQVFALVAVLITWAAEAAATAAGA